MLLTGLLLLTGCGDIVRLIMLLTNMSQRPVATPPAALISDGIVFPDGSNLFTSAMYQSNGNEWHAACFVNDYRNYGIRSAKWDAAAEAFINDYEYRGNYSGITNILKKLETQVREILTQGCTDPYLMYCLGNLLYLQGRYRQADQQIQQALQALEKSSYPSLYTFYASRRLLATRKAVRSLAPLPQALIEKELTALAQAASDPRFKDGHQRYFVENARDLVEGRCGKADTADRFMRQLEANDAVDPWISHVLEGIYHVSAAWTIRSGALAKEVSKKQWKGFFRELDTAREHLIKAHELHPEFPEAAEHMIVISMARSDDLGEQYWFNQAVTAQFDYLPAYRSLLLALYPRWGGSWEEMQAFGLRCLQTERFDTLVPNVYVRSIAAIAQDMGDDWREIYRQPHVYENLSYYYENALEHASNADARHFILSDYTLCAW
ncbi:MAG: DUF4034 domain-containing protein, partial [Lentisphaerota bacterium]